MFHQVWFGLIQIDRDESLRQLRVILPLNMTKKKMLFLLRLNAVRLKVTWLRLH